VPEPHQQVAVPIQCAQVGLEGRDGRVGAQPLLFSVDYRTVTELKSRIGKVVCPLGVGEHFEYWGFEPEKIIELDWHETAALGDGFAVHCLPSRHFSGRGLNPNRTLWASFLLETPARQVYMGGDGGYGKHFAQIGRQFPGIDLAILENRQYNEAWKYIHTMPDQLSLAAKELGAKQIITVHHSKFALARHRWDEPLATEAALATAHRAACTAPRDRRSSPVAECTRSRPRTLSPATGARHSGR